MTLPKQRLNTELMRWLKAGGGKAPVDINEVIKTHAHVPFVQRIINKNKYPKIQGNGWEATHKMAWAELGPNQYIAFPTISQSKAHKSGLIDMQQAGINPVDAALASRNYIMFKTAEEADYFTKNYKKYWSKK